jgi:hypothetical protein
VPSKRIQLQWSFSLSLDGVVVWKRVENGFDVIGLFSLVVVQERVVYYQGDFREEHEHRR